jgi:hypothetical protein
MLLKKTTLFLINLSFAFLLNVPFSSAVSRNSDKIPVGINKKDFKYKNSDSLYAFLIPKKELILEPNQKWDIEPDIEVEERPIAELKKRSKIAVETNSNYKNQEPLSVSNRYVVDAIECIPYGNHKEGYGYFVSIRILFKERILPDTASTNPDQKNPKNLKKLTLLHSIKINVGQKKKYGLSVGELREGLLPYFDFLVANVKNSVYIDKDVK